LLTNAELQVHFQKQFYKASKLQSFINPLVLHLSESFHQLEKLIRNSRTDYALRCRSVSVLTDKRLTWAIDQACCKDGCILGKVYFRVFMDQDGFDLHDALFSYLDRRSLGVHAINDLSIISYNPSNIFARAQLV